jgi:Cys-rich protein (TIGR01571 family)
MAEEPVTSQPRATTVTVEVPNIDVNHLMKGNWQVGCLDCFNDPAMCILGYCCPCILAWMNAEKLGENPMLFCLGGFCFPTITLMRYRTREKFGISGDIQDDVLMSGPVCGLLSLCQVHNEIKARSG